MEKQRELKNVLVQIASSERFKLYGKDCNMLGFTKPAKGMDAAPLPLAFRADVVIEPWYTALSERHGQAKRGCTLHFQPPESTVVTEGWDIVFLSEDGQLWKVFGLDYGDVTQLPGGCVRAKCVDLLNEPRTVLFDLPVTQPKEFL